MTEWEQFRTSSLGEDCKNDARQCLLICAICSPRIQLCVNGFNTTQLVQANTCIHCRRHNENVLRNWGAGFIGSHLCEQLLSQGHRVINIDNFNDVYDYKTKIRNILSSTGTSFPYSYSGDKAGIWPSFKPWWNRIITVL